MRDWMLGILIFGFMITLGANFFNISMGEYGLQPDENFTKIYDSVNSTMGDVDSIAGSTTEQLQTKQGLDDTGANAEVSVTSRMWKVLKLPLDLLTTTLTTIGTIGNVIGIPNWILNVFMSMVLIVVSYIAISALFRRNT